MTKFDYLNVPDQWNNYFTKYPQGYTILEALLNWVTSVNTLTDNVNDWNSYLDSFVQTFDTDLQDKVKTTLTDWNDSGFLAGVINPVLQTIITQTQTDIDNVQANKVDKGGNEQVTYAMLAQDAKTAFTGGQVAVVGTGAVNTMNVVDKAISAKKAAFLLNALTNLCPITQANYSWGTAQPTTLSFTDEGFVATASNMSGLFFHFNTAIGQTYTIGIKGSGWSNVRVMKADKTTTLVSAVYDPTTGYYYVTFTAQDVEYYLRFWLDSTHTSGTVTTGGVYAGNNYIQSYTFENDVFIPVNNINGLFVPSKNLYDKSKAVDGYLVNGSSGGGFTPWATHSMSDWIKVTPNLQYVWSVNANYAFYDVNQVFISGANSLSAGTAVTAPANAAFIRFSVDTTVTGIKDKCQLEQNTQATTYVPYGNTINPSYYNQNPTTLTYWYNNKKLTTFGDSITAQNKWQPLVNNKFGFSSIVNLGVGGTRISDDGTGTSMVTDSRVNTIPTDSDVVLLMGGTNDEGQNVPIGDMSYPYNITTFKGALAETIRKIKVRVPNAVFAVMSLPSGRGDVDVNGVAINGTALKTNTLGLTSKDYAAATQDVCETLSIPFIDVFGSTGINPFNRTSYIQDTVHPNDNGGTLIARVVTNGLKRVEPLL